jgi:hypothetical protein
MTVVIGGALVALLCGIALICIGVQDAGDGRARAILPTAFGALLTVGGLLFLRKGCKR